MIFSTFIVSKIEIQKFFFPVVQKGTIASSTADEFVYTSASPLLFTSVPMVVRKNCCFWQARTLDRKCCWPLKTIFPPSYNIMLMYDLNTCMPGRFCQGWCARAWLILTYLSWTFRAASGELVLPVKGLYAIILFFFFCSSNWILRQHKLKHNRQRERELLSRTLLLLKLKIRIHYCSSAVAVDDTGQRRCATIKIFYKFDLNVLVRNCCFFPLRFKHIIYILFILYEKLIIEKIDEANIFLSWLISLQGGWAKWQPLLHCK